MAIRIICARPGFRRAGAAHPAERTYPAGHWTAEQLDALKAEPLITVIEEPAEPAKLQISPGEAAAAAAAFVARGLGAVRFGSYAAGGVGGAAQNSEGATRAGSELAASPVQEGGPQDDVPPPAAEGAPAPDGGDAGEAGEAAGGDEPPAATSAPEADASAPADAAPIAADATGEKPAKRSRAR